MNKTTAQFERSLRIVRYPEVKTLVGYCRMHIDRLEKAGQFPKRVRLGANAVGWVEAEVNDWLAAKIAQRDVPQQEAPNVAA